MGDSCPANTDLCTLETCPLACAQVNFIPSLGGNIAYAIIIGLILLAHIGQGIFYRTWGFLVGMTCGLVLEIIGYAGRVMLHNNPFDFNAFLIYLIPLTIGPAFLTGSIYLCLSRIVVIHGEAISRITPRTYSIIFMSCDFVSLVLQGAGGGLAATANDQSGSDVGRNIMIAGMVFQVVSLVIFMGLWLEFDGRLKRSNEMMKNPRFAAIREARRFKWLTYALWAAAILIFIRSVYRIAELQGGFKSKIADDETVFLIFEGPMITLATLALALVHPGFAFGGHWAEAAWSLRGRKTTPGYEMDVCLPMYVELPREHSPELYDPTMYGSSRRKNTREHGIQSQLGTD